jgi:hypothetical protein
VESHELFFYNVDGLLAAEIRDRAPAKNHPLR